MHDSVFLMECNAMLHWQQPCIHANTDWIPDVLFTKEIYMHYMSDDVVFSTNK